MSGIVFDMQGKSIGELLKQQFLEKHGISQYELALQIKVTPRAIAKIIQGKQRITAGMSLRLAKYFGLEDDYFIKRQMMFDLNKEKEELREILSGISCIKEKVIHRG
jgi:addiction module HigA family antidote